MKTDKIKAHVAILTANIIFGLGIPVTAYLLSDWLSPMTYMALRCVGAAIIFWIIAAFMPKEKIEKRDLAVILAGGLLGFVVSQTLTAWALVYTTPVYFSLIATLVPVITMLMAAAFLGERYNLLQTTGIIIGIAGALLMVVMGWQNGTGKNDLLGIFLTLMSLLTWVVYLIITRKVSQKYTPVTQMKWIFLISAVVVLPFAWQECPEAPLLAPLLEKTSANMPLTNYLPGISAILFIIIFATVLGFFAIPYAMKSLEATTVSIYTNLQPVVASIVAFVIGQDVLTWDKPAAGALVLLSAYIVSTAKSSTRQDK